MIVSEIVEDYGKSLVKIGKEYDNVVVIDCDLSKSSSTKFFSNEYPQRYLNVGIAEQNAFGIAAGLASVGFIPIVHTFAVFASMRACDQIRNSICYTNMNVKIIGIKAGISDSYGGATHQAIDDIGIMSSIPNMVILSPCDGNEAQEAIKKAVEYNGPVYIRLNKMKMLNISNSKFVIGRAWVLKEGKDLTLMTTGDQLVNCIKASENLEKIGYSIKLVNISTIKPIDRDEILKCAEETKAIVVVETHNIINGLGSKVCSLLCREYPIPVRIVGINDSFTESGEYHELQQKYSISLDDIMETALDLLKHKKKQLNDREKYA